MNPKYLEFPQGTLDSLRTTVLPVRLCSTNLHPHYALYKGMESEAALSACHVALLMITCLHTPKREMSGHVCTFLFVLKVGSSGNLFEGLPRSPAKFYGLNIDYIRDLHIWA